MVWGYSLNWLSMTFMMLGMTLWVICLVVLAWAMIRWLNNRTTSSTRLAYASPGIGSTAHEILNQRYARGEIDAATFEHMWELLEGVDTTRQRNWVEEGHRPAGERLFDGKTRDAEIL